MQSVDDAFEVGGAIAYATPLGLARGDEAVLGVTVFVDVTDAHGGVVADLSAGYAFQATEALRLGVGLGASMADDSYMDSFFSVNARGAAASGLDRFGAGAGFRNVGVELNATYDIGQNWGVVGLASYTRLVGDAADSPIVDDAGAADQWFGAAGLYFRF